MGLRDESYDKLKRFSQIYRETWGKEFVPPMELGPFLLDGSPDEIEPAGFAEYKHPRAGSIYFELLDPGERGGGWIATMNSPDGNRKLLAQDPKLSGLVDTLSMMEEFQADPKA
jgi:hypothetical protein